VRRLRQRLPLAASAWLSALLWCTAGFAEEPIRHAIPSELATRTLLLDVARAGDRLVAVGEWGHVLLSDDGGKTWRQADSVPTRMTLTEVYFVDDRTGWAVGHDAVVLHTGDGGQTWELQFSAPEEETTLLSVWFENADHGIAVGAFGLTVETRDGGRTWKRRKLIEDSEDDSHLNHLFAGPDDSLFLAAEFGWIYRSRDTGTSWERFHPPYEGSFWGGIRLDGGVILVFGMRGHAFRSDDLGETWEAVDSGTDQSLQAALQLPDGAVVMVGLGGVVATSIDGGRTFRAVIEADRRGIASVALGADGALLLFGETGIKEHARPDPGARTSAPAAGGS
jgi:photosystem II stability/assembly factor-like uncharacterized protein